MTNVAAAPVELLLDPVELLGIAAQDLLDQGSPRRAADPVGHVVAHEGAQSSRDHDPDDLQRALARQYRSRGDDGLRRQDRQDDVDRRQREDDQIGDG